jgi:hypothetical protein
LILAKGRTRGGQSVVAAAVVAGPTEGAGGEGLGVAPAGLAGADAGSAAGLAVSAAAGVVAGVVERLSVL